VAAREATHTLRVNRSELAAIVAELVPGLCDRPGIGPVTAAQAIISFSHPGRCRSEAAFAKLAGTSPLEVSTGQTERHRLNQGGDRALNPAIHIIARTRYLREIEDLRATGADQVVPEEFETSIEIFSLVLQHYRMPARVIAEKAERIRQEGYALFRKGQPGLKEIVAKEADDLYVDD